MTERIRGKRGCEQRARIHRRDNGMCQRCKRQGRIKQATQVDHINALLNGGTNDDSNMESICDDCHAIKTREDKGFKPSGACDTNGMPRDERHPWNLTGRGCEIPTSFASEHRQGTTKSLRTARWRDYHGKSESTAQERESKAKSHKR